MSRRTLSVTVTVAAMIGLAVVVADAHDLFLRPRDFVVRAGTEVHIRVLNGTLTTSEAPVARSRLRDLTVGPAGASHPDRSSWTDSAKESNWRVEGLPHILAARKAARQLGDSAHERYAKHVKALVRVEGGQPLPPGADTAHRVVLGYPAELVPLDDPYRLRAGGMLRVRALVDGRPVSNQVVQAGGRTRSGQRIAQREVRTDSDGIGRFRMDTRGTWDAKFISMRPVPASANC